MVFDENGVPDFNVNTANYMKELNEAMEALTTLDTGLKNKQIINIAMHIKAIYRGLTEKAKHAKEAYEFMTKCMPLKDLREYQYNTSLQLYSTKAEFAKLIEVIDSENFFYLLDSSLQKNRRVVFEELEASKISVMLLKYKQTLIDLEYIQENRMELLKHWIGYTEMTDTTVWVTAKTNKDTSSYLELDYNAIDRTFTGTQYRLKYFEVRMSEVEVSFDEALLLKETRAFIDVFAPELLI